MGSHYIVKPNLVLRLGWGFDDNLVLSLGWGFDNFILKVIKSKICPCTYILNTLCIKGYIIMFLTHEATGLQRRVPTQHFVSYII